MESARGAEPRGRKTKREKTGGLISLRLWAPKSVLGGHLYGEVKLLSVCFPKAQPAAISRIALARQRPRGSKVSI